MLRPSASDDHWSSVAPSRRMTPRAGAQMPASARASEDLPEPLGPMTPSAIPALSVKPTSCSATAWLPGGATLSAVTRSDWRGAGSGTRDGSAGDTASAPASRRQLCRAATKVRQLAIACSIGASARDVMMVAAMITPGARLLSDHQKGAEREHGGLEQEAQDARGAAEAGREIGDRLLALQIAGVLRAPSLRHAGAHAERADDPGIAPRRFGELLAARRQTR